MHHLLHWSQSSPRVLKVDIGRWSLGVGSGNLCSLCRLPAHRDPSPFFPHLFANSPLSSHFHRTLPICFHIFSPISDYLMMWCYLHADFEDCDTALPKPCHPLSLFSSLFLCPSLSPQFSDKQEGLDQNNVIAQQPANAICLKDQVFVIHLPLNSCPQHFSCSCNSSLFYPSLFFISSHLSLVCL